MHVFLYRLCQYVSCLLWERKGNSLTKALVNEYFSTTMQLCTQPWNLVTLNFLEREKNTSKTFWHRLCSLWFCVISPYEKLIQRNHFHKLDHFSEHKKSGYCTTPVTYANLFEVGLSTPELQRALWSIQIFM